MAGSASYHGEYALRSLFKRCQECADQQPSCPTCKSDETCIQKPGDGCNTCPQAICVSKAQAGLPSGPQSSDGGPNVGAIAGGVVGGVVFIAIVTFILWRFCIRPRYQDYDGEEEEFPDEYAISADEKSSPHTIESDFRPTSEARQSHHSVRSVASTVMTRASNVIQIAFIPGITDRQGHHDGDSDVPPVPTIPLSQQRKTPSSVSSMSRDHHPGTPDHFFTPSDLGGGASRWSQFSNSTTDSADVRSMRHHSLASSLARESVASTIFQDGHTATAMATPVSAGQVRTVQGKANMISVRPSATGTPSSSASHVPDVPTVDYFKYGDAKKAAEAGGKKAHPLATNIIPGNGSDKDLSVVGSEETKKPSNRMLAAAIEEATRRASRQPTHGGLGSMSGPGQGKSSQLAKPGDGNVKQRDPSPFSDSNAVETP